MVKKIHEYTRTELEQIKSAIIGKQRELIDFGKQSISVPASVREALESEGNQLASTIDHIDAQLARLHAKCVFCKTRMETDVPTISFICQPCDDRIFGKVGK